MLGKDHLLQMTCTVGSTEWTVKSFAALYHWMMRLHDSFKLIVYLVSCKLPPYSIVELCQ